MVELGWLITHLAALAGLAVGWFLPVFGLMVYYAFAILRPMELWFWNHWPIQRLSLYVALSTLVGWMISGFGRGGALRPVWLPILGFGLYLLGGTVAWQLDDIAPARAWYYLSIQLKIGLMAMVTITLLRNEKTIFAFAYLIIASIGYMAWVFNSSYYFQGWNRVWPNGIGVIDNNGIAMIMVMGVPMAFFIAIHSTHLWIKGLCFFAVAMMVHVVLLSFSRGGQLGLIIVGASIFVVALARLPRKVLTISMAVLFVCFGLYYAGPEVRARFGSIFVDSAERDASAQSRFVTWAAAWQCIKDHPMGVGPRNFNILSAHYGLGPNKSVHNLFLQTGADYGIAGMVGLAVFYFGTMFQTFRMTVSRTAKQLNWPRFFGQMVCVSLGGFLVCSMFIGVESLEMGYIVALLGLCTVAHVAHHSAIEPVDDTVPELADVPPPGEASRPIPT